jgi:hypothetical protein
MTSTAVGHAIEVAPIPTSSASASAGRKLSIEPVPSSTRPVIVTS